MGLMIDRLGVLRQAHRLRTDDEGKVFWIPLTAVEYFGGRQEFLSVAHHPVRLGPGATVRSIMDALVPWAPIISLMLQIDYSAWHRALKLPIAVDALASLEEIVIEQRAGFKAVPIYSEEDLDEFWSSLSTEQPPPIGVPSDKIELFHHWWVYGRKRGRDNKYSLNFTSLRQVADLPVILTDEVIFYDGSQSSGRALSCPHALLNPDSAFVKTRTYRDGGMSLYLMATSSPSLDASIIRGLLRDLCHGKTPREADDETKNDIASIRRNYEAVASSPGSDTPHDDGNDAAKPMTVTIAPGAFDAFFADQARENELTVALLNSLARIERRAVVEERED